jgi:translation initiation factor 4E transporter
VKEDDLDVVLSPQRRSFGGGCHVTAASSSRRSGSPLEKDGDGLRLLGGRRIGSGRIISARTFEKDHRLSDKDLRDLRDRDRDYKDKRFRVRPLDSGATCGGLMLNFICTGGRGVAGGWCLLFLQCWISKQGLLYARQVLYH